MKNKQCAQCPKCDSEMFMIKTIRYGVWVWACSECNYLEDVNYEPDIDTEYDAWKEGQFNSH